MGNFIPSTPSSIIDEKVKEHCVVMYSTTVCSFCTKAKSLLNDMGLDYHVVEIDQMPPSEGGKVSRDLRDKTRVMTVPQIFINGKFVGGYSEMLTLQRTGDLLSKIAECGVKCKDSPS